MAFDSKLDVRLYDAAPAPGNFTDDVSAHIWCAESLAILLTGEGQKVLSVLNDNVQDGVLYLLASELRRARQALAAEQASSSPHRNSVEV